MAVVTEHGRMQRAKEVDSALASVRMEGLEPSEAVKALFQRYVEGDLTSAEMDRAMEAHLDRAYGPIRLSGHKRP